MKCILDYFVGYVILYVEGIQIERFLNLCRNHKILLKDIEIQKEHKIRIQMRIQDFFRLKSLREKTRVHIHIIEKHGLPFFFHNNKKRKAFIIGIILAGLLVFLFSGRIWNIQINGDFTRSEKEILQFLQTEGVFHGMSKQKLDCSALSSKLREKYSEIAWVSAKTKGVKLLVNMQESILVPEKEEEENVPCDIVANRSGTIVKMITRKGIPLKRVGEYCKADELIVSGTIEIKNDNQETIRYEYVHADADIFLKYDIPYYREIPLIYEQKTANHISKRCFFMKWKNHYLEVGIPPKKSDLQTRDEYLFYLTENFLLPFSVGKIIYKNYQNKTEYYTEEEIRAISWKYMQNYEEKLIEKGLQISVNNVKIEVNDQICVSSGKLEVIEKIEKKTPIANMEQPIERNTANGEQYH